MLWIIALGCDSPLSHRWQVRITCCEDHVLYGQYGGHLPVLTCHIRWVLLDSQPMATFPSVDREQQTAATNTINLISLAEGIRVNKMEIHKMVSKHPMRWFNKLLQVWFSAFSEGEDISDGWAHIWRKRSCFEYIRLNSLTNSLWFMTFDDLWENRQELGIKYIPKVKLWKEIKRFKLFDHRPGPNLISRKMKDEWNVSIRSLFSELRNTEKVEIQI